MAGALKQTTGLTGLLVARDPHKSLSIIYTKILSVLQKMPESATYRKHTQVRHNLMMVRYIAYNHNDIMIINRSLLRYVILKPNLPP